MFRHNIGGMRNLLGQEVRADKMILVDDTPLPVNLGSGFIVFLNDNKLPNGRVNPLPTLTLEERALMTQPYREWAPAPYNDTRIRSESATNLFMFSTTGLDHLFDFEALFTGGGQIGLSKIDYELHFNKQRAWGGLPPISDRRWKEKGLKQLDTSFPPKNFVKAIDHLEKTGVFLFFNISEVQSKMRKAYNKLYDILTHFDTVLTAHYTRQGLGTPPPTGTRGKAADLWAEFFFSQVEYMTTCTHQWYMNHANAMHAQFIEELRTAPPRTGPPPPTGNPVDHVLRKLDTLMQHRRKAEYSFLIPLTGFKNTLPHWRHVSSPPLVNWTEHISAGGRLPIPAGSGTYPQDPIQREAIMINRHQYLLTELVKASNPEARIDNGRLEGGGDTGVLVHQQIWQALDQAASELRGTPLIPTPITEELWITNLRCRLAHPEPTPQYTRWGWIAYRLDYSHSDEEWTTFLERFTTDIDKWSVEGNVLGSESVKSSMEITWLDGREFNLAENDMAAARAHFKSLKESKSPLVDKFLLAPAFLVADETAVSSYLNPPVLPGQDYIDAADLLPHIVLVQDKFDAPRAANDRDAPGYEGFVHVAGSLLMEDVFPGLFMTMYQMKDMWNIAASHPTGLYLGVWAEYQNKFWGSFNQMQLRLWKAAENYGGGRGQHGPRR
ncbi:hypothetical protein V8F06_005956 [Rhypophila decipiens]